MRNGKSQLAGRLGLLVLGLSGSARPAWAQQMTPVQPIIGQVSTQSGNSATAADTLSVQPTISITYDSNLLRRNPDLVAGPTDNLRSTAALGAVFDRRFGRTELRLRGSFGYDFNSQFKYLNQKRLSASANVILPVGAQCPVSASAGHQQFQYDFDDTDRLVRSTQRIENFSLDLACSRPGLSPAVGGIYRSIENSASPLADSRYAEGHLGLRLTVPSLGSLTLNGQRARISRPKAKDLLGINDSTDISRVYLALDRSVAARLQISGNAGFVKATPSRRSVPGFSGASFEGEVRYAMTPRLRLTVGASQDVQNSPGISSTYYVRKELRGGLDIDLHRTKLNFLLSRLNREFVGDDVLTGFQQSSDVIDSVLVGASRDIGRRLTVMLSASLRSRDADVDLYDYDSKIVALRLSSKF